MKKLTGQEITGVHDYESKRVFSDIEFNRCDFKGCSVSVTRNPHNRSTIRNVIWNDCSVEGCAVYAAVIEDSIINNLKTENLLRMSGTLFKHVTFKGKVGEILIIPEVFPGRLEAEKQQAFDRSRIDYYNAVDWALDISEAEFVSCDIRSVPAHLIRRDPETQMILTREKAAAEWQHLDLSKTYWSLAREILLDSGESDVILVAPKANRKFEQFLKELETLRNAGIVY